MKTVHILFFVVGSVILASGQSRGTESISTSTDFEERSVPSKKSSELVISKDKLNALRMAGHTHYSGIITKDTRDACRIMRISYPSPAAEAGLQPGDYVLAVDGRSVETTSELAQHLRLAALDHLSHWTIKRGDIVEIYPIRLIDRKKRQEPKHYIVYDPFLGATLMQDLMDNRLYITTIDENGLAFDHGLQTGDHLFKLDETYLSSAREIPEIIKSLEDRSAQLIVKRDYVPLDILMVW